MAGSTDLIYDLRTDIVDEVGGRRIQPGDEELPWHIEDRNSLRHPAHTSDAAGAFALGALSRRDREDFVAHLDSCPPCDTEVDSLLPVVRLLDAGKLR